ncbi:MAG: sterol desaturase family protein [Deltaproteobacteria bacterium]|nr:sterol desaturase family protein [Deltaproteobacteria bacterium]
MDWAILAPLVIVTGALVIIGLERVAPYDRGQRFLRRGLFMDLVLYGLIQSYLLALVIRALIGWIDARTGASSHGLVSGWPIALQVGFFVVTHDLYIYGFHRLQHRNRYLWRLHEAHHSATQIDWIAGSRSHALEILINQSIEFGAMILLGADPDVVLIKGAISAVWGMWIHANVGVRTGWLQHVINGPEMHRWHHARKYIGDGQNYGTKLAIWDWLFGTAYLPPEKPDGYGLADPFPSGFLAQQAYAFRRHDAPPARSTAA